MNKTDITRETIELILRASTATLTTVLNKHGIRHSGMHRVAPLRRGMKMAGPAFTLRYIPAREDLKTEPTDNLKDPQRIGIETISTGEVFVIDARGDDRAGTLGAILATRLHMRGAAGVVTDGAYRDCDEIADCGLPAFARSANSHANTTIHHASEIQVPIACGGIAVFPGDIIAGDGDGVVVVPAHLVEQVAVEAAEKEAEEEFIIKKIRGGASIIGNYPPDEATLKEFESGSVVQ